MESSTETILVRPHLSEIPQFTLPSGYFFRTYQRGDEEHWVRIHELADKWNVVTFETFFENFGEDLRSLEDRCFFLLNERRVPIGTATAWYDRRFQGKEYGRVHWVAIVPDYQGKGLAKPLLTRVMNRLAESHDRCYLTTSIERIPAIALYLKYGFRPLIDSIRAERLWKSIEGSFPVPLVENALRPETL